MSTTHTQTAPSPIADLPTGDPIPSTTTPPPSSSPAKLPPIPLAALLAATPSHLDAFLAHLNRCLSTPSGIDTVLLFVCYTSRLAGSLLTALSARRRRPVALVAASGRLPTVLVSGGGSALVLAGRLRALSALLSEARTILRLWGLLGMYFWGRGLVLRTVRQLRRRRSATTTTTTAIEKPSATTVEEGEASSTLDTSIAYAQLISCVLFQTLENGAYLSSRGVLGWTPRQQAVATRWSSRLWGVYVGIELGRLAAARPATAAKGAKGEGEEDKWRRQVARNLAWAPLTVHWGLENGFVKDWMVGLLGSVPGVLQMGELWRENSAA